MLDCIWMFITFSFMLMLDIWINGCYLMFLWISYFCLSVWYFSYSSEHTVFDLSRCTILLILINIFSNSSELNIFLSSSLHFYFFLFFSLFIFSLFMNLFQYMFTYIWNLFKLCWCIIFLFLYTKIINLKIFYI